MQVILPASYGSFGDEALAAGVAAVASLNDRSVQLLAPGCGAEWTAGGLEVESIDRHRRAPTWWMNRRGVEFFSSNDVTVLGADTVTGAYEHQFLAFRVRALNLSAVGSNQAKLVNFSYGSTASELSRRLLRTLEPSVELWARDELSRERAQQAIGREVMCAPDVGAFMPPVQRATEVRINRRRVILVPNAHFSVLFGVPHAALVGFWTELARCLRPAWDVWVMPHDVRESPGDIELASEIAQVAGEEALTLFVPKNAAEAKSVLGASGLCVAARMHACVGALSLNVRTVGLEYLQKFAGQFAWYGDIGETVPFAGTTDVGNTLRAIERVQRSNGGSPLDIHSIAWMGPMN